MEWFREAKAGAEAKGWRFTLSGSLPDSTVRECERQLSVILPANLRRFLLEYGSGTLFHEDGAVAGSGLQMLNPLSAEHGITSRTTFLRASWGEHAQDLIVFAHTPGAGAFYLATTKDGQIVDLWGLPDREQQDRRFPAFQGEWRIIAPSFDALLQRMFQAEEPLFWL